MDISILLGSGRHRPTTQKKKQPGVIPFVSPPIAPGIFLKYSGFTTSGGKSTIENAFSVFSIEPYPIVRWRYRDLDRNILS